MSCLTRFGPQCRGPRLICLPFAGASGDAFAPWVAPLRGALELWAATPAGRRHRHTEPFNEDPNVLVGEVAAELRALGDRPVVLFGYSMGGLIGYEVAADLERTGAPPGALIVAATPAPHVRAQPDPRSYTDAELVATLGEWGGTPSELLADPEARALVLPPLRADLRLCDAYRRTEPAPTSVPLWTLAGSHDPVAPVAAVRPWSAYSSRFQGISIVSGGHFFLHSHQQQTVDLVVQFAQTAQVAFRS